MWGYRIKNVLFQRSIKILRTLKSLMITFLSPQFVKGVKKRHSSPLSIRRVASPHYRLPNAAWYFKAVYGLFSLSVQQPLHRILRQQFVYSFGDFGGHLLFSFQYGIQLMRRSDTDTDCKAQNRYLLFFENWPQTVGLRLVFHSHTR